MTRRFRGDQPLPNDVPGQRWRTSQPSRRARSPRHRALHHFFTSFAEPQPILDSSDPDVSRELAQLYNLDLSNRRPGVDLRQQANRVIRTEATRSRLEQSDDLVRRLSCHSSLRSKRRLGILRHLSTDAAQEGLPVFAPPPPPRPDPRFWPDLEIHWGAYLDELEWEPFWIVRTGYGWRPTFAVMNSFAMRSVLWLRASYFYYANTSLLIPGRLLPETKYDTETVMRWVFREAYRLATRQR